MRDHLVAIKLGGSLIADKTKPRSIKYTSIKTATTEIAKLYNGLDADIILGTGGGSAHITAPNRPRLNGNCSACRSPMRRYVS